MRQHSLPLFRFAQPSPSHVHNNWSPSLPLLPNQSATQFSTSFRFALPSPSLCTTWTPISFFVAYQPAPPFSYHIPNQHTLRLLLCRQLTSTIVIDVFDPLLMYYYCCWYSFPFGWLLLYYCCCCYHELSFWLIVVVLLLLLLLYWTFLLVNSPIERLSLLNRGALINNSTIVNIFSNFPKISKETSIKTFLHTQSYNYYQHYSTASPTYWQRLNTDLRKFSI